MSVVLFSSKILPNDESLELLAISSSERRKRSGGSAARPAPDGHINENDVEETRAVVSSVFSGPVRLRLITGD